MLRRIRSVLVSVSSGGCSYTTRTSTCYNWIRVVPYSYSHFATLVLPRPRICNSNNSTILTLPTSVWNRSKPRTHYNYCSFCFCSTTGVDIVVNNSNIGGRGGATTSITNTMVEPPNDDDDDDDELPSSSPSSCCHHLAPYQMYNWRPNPKLSNDENYMDMVLLLTRNSTCRQGHMACAIVKPVSPPLVTTTNVDNNNNNNNNASFYNSIQAVGINGPIFKPLDSDNHAEIATIGLAAKHGRALEGCTAYITMPPCKTCFGALVASGIQRIVTPKPAKEPIVGAAKNYGIVLDTVSNEESQNRVMTYVLQDPDAIQADRQVRKERQERKKKRRKQESHVEQGINDDDER